MLECLFNRVASLTFFYRTPTVASVDGRRVANNVISKNTRLEDYRAIDSSQISFRVDFHSKFLQITVKIPQILKAN